MKNGLKAVNVALFVSFAIQAAAGLWLVWGDSELVAQIHKYNGLVFVALCLAHITLNWNWVKAVLLKSIGAR